MRTPLKLPAGLGPVLVLVVDTEEEFNWGAGFDRNATSVTAMAEIGRFQAICDQFSVAPCYVVDYPVSSQPQGYEPLLEAAADERCEIGAHLHPWVNPPHTETVNAFHSYPGNLDAELERAKLEALSASITKTFGKPPSTYKAGRYGIGANTPATLRSLGFKVDLSPAPGFDYRRDGGPDFTRHSPNPYWLDSNDELLCLPTTGGFTGGLSANLAARAHAAGDLSLAKTLRLRGVLSRLGLARQQRLTPEGYSLEENRRLTETFLRRGVEVFSYSFHSPSLKPGCTSYTSNPAEVEAFLRSIELYLRFWIEETGGQVMTPAQLRDKLA